MNLLLPACSFQPLCLSDCSVGVCVCVSVSASEQEWDTLPMPSVNQCWGVMHGQLWNINCFHLTLLLARVHLLYAFVSTRSWQAYAGGSISITLSDWGWCAPPPQGGRRGPLANRAALDVWLSCSDEPEEKCITTLIHWLCVCILWVRPPTSPPPNTVIDLLFNAQTNSSLSSFQVIFLAPSFTSAIL